MKRAVLGIVVAVLLAGCDGDGDARADQQASGPFGGLDGDKLCALVDRATIDEQFRDPIRNTLGGKGRPDQRESVACDYVTDSLMKADGMAEISDALSIGTRVRLASEEATTAQEALDAYMINLEDETIAYEPVDGLGKAAGYAASELHVLTGGNHLVAILEVDGAFIEVVAKSEPAGTLDQLRPIADELVEAVESELG